jgi:hypothetical protein
MDRGRQRAPVRPLAAPAITSLNPTSGPPAGGNTVTITGTNLTGATAVRFGANLAAFTVVSSTQINAVAPAGSGAVSVTASSPAGTSNALTYTYVTAPSVTSVSPSQGPLPGGNTVTITGSGFTGATSVQFGSAPAASFTVLDTGLITATVPGGNPPGPVQVTVTTPGGTSNGISYFYLPAPTVTDVTPNQGPTGGGNSVTITGSGFTGATAVWFGAAPASSFTVVSDTQITATAPAGSGSVPVTVTTPGGTSTTPVTSSYTYLPAPTVTSLVPSQGPAAGGNTVTITGTNLTFTTAVHFGANPAPFTVLSDTQVTAVAPPAAAGQVPVRVTTPGGTSSDVPYTYVAPPGG